MSRSCWDLDVQANAERLCEYLRIERPVLKVGSTKCRAFMDLRSMNRRDPKFSKTLEAGMSHLKSLMAIYHWQNEQGRWFLHEDPHHSWSQNTTALRSLESLSGVRVTKMKQFKRSLDQVLQILERRQFYSPRRGLRRILEEVTGATHTVPKLDRLWKRNALCRSLQMKLDKFHMMKSLDCHLTPSWWLTPTRKS